MTWLSKNSWPLKRAKKYARTEDGGRGKMSALGLVERVEKNKCAAFTLGHHRFICQCGCPARQRQIVATFQPSRKKENRQRDAERSFFSFFFWFLPPERVQFLNGFFLEIRQRRYTDVEELVGENMGWIGTSTTSLETAALQRQLQDQADEGNQKRVW